MQTLVAQALQNEPTKWAVIVLAILTIIYVVMRPSLRRNKDPLSKEHRSSSLAQQRSVERQMSSLLVELSEMARQISAQLDTRSAKLEILIKQADEKLAALKMASAASESTPM